jgi:hypothetical protein
MSGNGTFVTPTLWTQIMPEAPFWFDPQKWTLPFRADYYIKPNHYNPDSIFIQLGTYLGSEPWDEVRLNAGTINFNKSIGYIEAKLPLTKIGNPSQIYILGYICSTEWAGELYYIGPQPFRDVVGTYGSWPASSLDGGDGDKNQNGNFSHYFGYNLIAGVSPNDSLAHYDVPLPVELSSFSAENINGKVKLSWVTESEINNYAFFVERSADQVNFEKIAKILGQGSTSSRTEYSYIDEDVTNGETYYYRLYDLDYEGVRTYHQVQSVTIEQKDLIFTNEAYILHNNYPNPFNPVTTIEFDVSEIVEGGAQINLSVYNLLGQKVITLLKGNYESGNYKIQWNGKDAYGRDVPSGIYFYQITSSNHNYKIIKKMSLLR